MIRMGTGIAMTISTTPSLLQYSIVKTQGRHGDSLQPLYLDELPQRTESQLDLKSLCPSCSLW